MENLKQLTAGRSDVFIYAGDSNEVLVRDVFPRVRYEDYKRGLCLLDPYGLTLNWEVIASAAKTKAIEIFLNFPIMDMNRNALWSNPAGVAEEDRRRMTAFWGDESWQEVVYRGQPTLFGGEELIKARGNADVVKAFRDRLRTVAGFEEVPEPIPMRNSKKATVYYLFFASHNKTGAKIARHLLERYAMPESG